jgi:hypothetical protein
MKINLLIPIIKVSFSIIKWEMPSLGISIAPHYRMKRLNLAKVEVKFNIFHRRIKISTMQLKNPASSIRKAGKCPTLTCLYHFYKFMLLSYPSIRTSMSK